MLCVAGRYGNAGHGICAVVQRPQPWRALDNLQGFR
jgi:hypothetical protein